MLKHLCRKLARSHPGYFQNKPSNPGYHGFSPVAITVALPFLCTLIRLGLEMLRDLGLKNLV
jgi:hypothetical protein